jgi:hypothetical protein
VTSAADGTADIEAAVATVVFTALTFASGWQHAKVTLVV